MTRCVARTKDLERCRNDAERGSIFCRRHRRWWIISLFGTIVAVTTLGANLAQMFGITFPNPFLTRPTVSIDEIATPPYSSGSIRLVPIDSQNIVAKLGNMPISPDGVIPSNETVTVHFKILNNDTSPVTIRSLVIGSRGPGVNCEDANIVKWSAPDVPFQTYSNITIQPGEVYEYQGSRAFYLPGKYFLEPILQGPSGAWGGIQPFTCMSISVAETPPAQVTQGTLPAATVDALIPHTPTLISSNNLLTPTVTLNASCIQWEFNTNGDREGWQVNFRVSNLRVEGGALRGEFEQSDPSLISPQHLNIDTARYKSLSIGYQIDSNDTDGQLMWNPENSSNFLDAMQTVFGIIADGQWHVLNIRLQDSAGWSLSPVINTLRLDPVHNATSGTFAYDYIRICESGG